MRRTMLVGPPAMSGPNKAFSGYLWRVQRWPQPFVCGKLRVRLVKRVEIAEEHP